MSLRCSLLFGAILSSACDSHDASIGTAVSRLAIDTTIPRAAEDPLLELANSAPDFAGYYCDNGDLVIAVTGAATDNEVTAIISKINRMGTAFYCHTRENPTHDPQFRVVVVTFSFLQLRSWRDERDDDFFTTPGAISIGIGYIENQIVLEVDPGQMQAFQEWAQSRGLPSDAVSVREKSRPSLMLACPPPPYSSTSLGGCFRPVSGGVLINTVKSDGTAIGSCTVGTAATRSGVPGWVTASHCFGKTLVGVLAGSKAYQVDSSTSLQYLGTEQVDPPTFLCGLWQCRYSDSTWFPHDSSTTGEQQQGQIAQPKTYFNQANCCANSCLACTTSTTAPRFQIRNSASPVTNMQVDKVGITTGWTTGSVSNICVDIDDGNGHIIKCSIITTNYVDYGDSGSPLFYWWSQYGVNTTQLVGLVWGADGAGHLYASPWSGVTQDLGTIDITYAPSWHIVSGVSATDIGVGGTIGSGSLGYVWIIGTTLGSGGYPIQKWDGATWTTVPGAAVRISVDPSGNAWVVTSTNYIFRWNGTSWVQLPGGATDIAVGANGSAWVVGTNPVPGGYGVWYWNGSNWTSVSGGAVRIAVDASGNPWIIAADNTIWRWVGGAFQQVPGAGVDVGVSQDNLVWVLGTGAVSGGYQIYWWSGQDFVLASGGATAIAANRGGQPWIVDSSHNVWRSY